MLAAENRTTEQTEIWQPRSIIIILYISKIAQSKK